MKRISYTESVKQHFLTHGSNEYKLLALFAWSKTITSSSFSINDISSYMKDMALKASNRDATPQESVLMREFIKVLRFKKKVMMMKTTYSTAKRLY